MKQTISLISGFAVIALLMSLLSPSKATAELRVMAIEITRGEKNTVQVSIYSDVKEEKKQKIAVAEAATVMKGAQGWGNSVIVSILCDGVQLSEYMPVLKAISENAWTDLIHLTTRGGPRDHILDYWKVK